MTRAWLWFCVTGDRAECWARWHWRWLLVLLGRWPTRKVVIKDSRFFQN